MPKLLFPSVTALLLGAQDPHLKKIVGSHIGDTNLKVDAHGDALGVAHLPGERWRLSHDALKFQIYLDARLLGGHIQSEVYGLFTHHHSDEGRAEYGNLS